MNLEWQTFLNDQGAQISDGRVIHFGNEKSELAATQSGNVLVDLSHIGLLEISGDDAVTFLQGQVTNDVKLLDGSNSQLAGYCTPKGRLLAIFFLFAHNGHLHLQMNQALLAQTMKRLKMYVMRSKVVIEDITDSNIRFGIAGADSRTALEAVFPNIPEVDFGLATLDNATILRLPGPAPRYEIFTTITHAAQLWQSLKARCQTVGANSWDWLNIQAGIPEVTTETVEAFVPQMVNLDCLNGINFKKGCYTGQEIVARAHYLGKVKRRTVLAHIAKSEALASPGNPVFIQGEKDAIGQIVSTSISPNGGQDVLAEIRLEGLADEVSLHLGKEDGDSLALVTMPYPI